MRTSLFCLDPPLLQIWMQCQGGAFLLCVAIGFGQGLLLNFLNLSDAYLAHLPRPSAAADLVQELAFDAPSPPCTTFSRPPPTFFFVLGVEQGLAEFVEFVECVHRSSVSTSRSRYFRHDSRRVCDEPSLPCQVAPILLSCTATNITTIATGSGQHQPARGRDNDGHA